MFKALRSRLSQGSPTRRLTILLLLIATGTTHCAPFNWNDESRMATIQSLVESKTLVIDDSEFAGTGDKVLVAGHFYSEKPAFPALMGAAVYVPLYALGFRLHLGYSVAYYLITLLTVSMAWVFGTLALYSALRFTDLDQESRSLVALALGLGSLFLTWSTTFNNHAIAAGCLSIGFMFFLRARFDGGRSNMACAGLFMAVAAASDIPTAVFFALFGGYVLAARSLRANAAFFLLPILVTAIPTALINYSIHSSIMPVQIYRQYFDYPGSPWIGSGELSGVGWNSPSVFFVYALRSLFGPAGFILYNPFLLLALIGCWRVLKSRGKFWRECLCILSGSVVICAYYWATTSNYGGRSYSIRWFVPLLPLLFFFLYPFARTRKKTFIGLLGVSNAIALVGALNPWSALAYSNVPFIDNIQGFFQHLPPGMNL